MIERVQVDQIWNNPRKLNGSVKRIKNIDTWTDNLQLKLYDQQWLVCD